MAPRFDAAPGWTAYGSSVIWSHHRVPPGPKKRLAFARVFHADAGCIAIALIAVVLMAERPLQEEP